MGELIIFALVGIVGGVIGALFVKVTKWSISLVNQVKLFEGARGIILRAVLVGLSVSLLTYPFPLIRNDQQGIDYIFDSSQKQLDAIPFLLGMVIIKFIITVLSQLAGLSCGVYTPLFVLGAAFGRCIGEIIALIVPNEISPLSYAVVGAGSVCASATHTISTAVIVVELTGQFHLMLPILLGVLFADGIGKLLSKSIYDELLLEKGLPFMPSFVVGSSMQNLTAQDIMETEESVRYLTLNSTFADAKAFTRAGRFSNYNFPLVDDTESMTLLGVVKRTELVKILSTAKRNVKLFKEQTRRANRVHSLSLPSEEKKEEKEEKIDEQESVEIEIEEEFQLPDHFEKIESYSSFREVADDSFESASLLSADSQSTHQDGGLDSEIWNQTLPYVFTNSDVQSDFRDIIIVDPTPFQISENVTIAKIHFIFTMLGLRDICVTQRGRFVGLITKNKLLDYLQ